VELGQVLGALPLLQDPDVLVGAGSRDDAAVYRIADDRALVATVDFFTPIVDDPRAFGAIAAANSVSDVYAMGGKPLFALSILAWPREVLEGGILEQIVAGGAAKLVEAGAPVVGGHSIDDPEPKFGYAVVGEVDPARMITNEGAQAGDLLYLTKPLGSGLAATAIKRGECPPKLEAGVIALMTHLNRQAGEAMVAAGAHAATDVTGYGLIGHLVNLRVGAEIELSRVPMLDGVRGLAARDLFPGGTRRNHEALAPLVLWEGLDLQDQLLLCDAQTSGGLLVALPPDRADDFERRLADAPWPPARIGRVTDDGSIHARP
jgi:selenide,water dikinase